ncbi:MAG: hypothetical protein WBN92_02985 [Terriglobia bacterium]
MEQVALRGIGAREINVIILPALPESRQQASGDAAGSQRAARNNF